MKMTRHEKIEALEEAAELLHTALNLISGAAVGDSNKQAYVVDQISESISNGNPYNQSVESWLEELYNAEDEDGECSICSKPIAPGQDLCGDCEAKSED